MAELAFEGPATGAKYRVPGGPVSSSTISWMILVAKVWMSESEASFSSVCWMVCPFAGAGTASAVTGFEGEACSAASRAALRAATALRGRETGFTTSRAEA